MTTRLYEGKPKMLVVRIWKNENMNMEFLSHRRRPKSDLTIILFCNGKCHLMSGTSLHRDVAELEINRLLCCLADGLPRTLPPVRHIRTQTKTFVLNIFLGRINLSNFLAFLQNEFGSCSTETASSWRFSYEPEIFPALQIRTFSPIHINVFTSGRAVVLGIKRTRQINDIRNYLICNLQKFINGQ